jgi:uncharacterized membrane protein
MRNILFVLALIATGLSAGVFFTWSISVIPGLKVVSDKSYLAVMQAINRAILNPFFFTVFIGAIPLVSSATYVQFREAVNLSFWCLLVSLICYVLGTFGVTVVGNVPMNEALDAVCLDQLSAEELKFIRGQFEDKWNSFNMIRTIFSCISFMAIVLAGVFRQTGATKI